MITAAYVAKLDDKGAELGVGVLLSENPLSDKEMIEGYSNPRFHMEPGTSHEQLGEALAAAGNEDPDLAALLDLPVDGRSRSIHDGFRFEVVNLAAPELVGQA